MGMRRRRLSPEHALDSSYTHINSNNVDEVLVVCESAQQIYRYLKASKMELRGWRGAERLKLKLSPKSTTPLIRICNQMLHRAGDSLKNLIN